MSGAEGQTNQTGQFNQNQVRDYLVRLDGTAELPKVGVIKASGLTIVELTNKIVSILSKSYIDPFVQIRLTNQRVIVFTGLGKAEVVYLRNQNTTLLEALAMAGGIAEYSKANNIRVMRKVKNNQREIYKIDLSTIKGVKEASMIVQSEDYIYVDYRPRVANRTIKEVGPWLPGLFSAFSLYDNKNVNSIINEQKGNQKIINKEFNPFDSFRNIEKTLDCSDFIYFFFLQPLFFT